MKPKFSTMNSDIFERLAEITKPNPNADLIKELDKENLFIVRNDGVILTDEIGNKRIESIHNPKGNEIELKRLNDMAKHLKTDFTFSLVLISEYKKQNPNFNF